MPHYADAEQVAAARARYFDANGFDESGYGDDWVRFKIGPIPIVFPNTASRKAAVPCHDLHHLATGYGTDLAGEAEIGAWEIGSGCLQVRAALVLNMLAIWPVLFFAPARVYRAFVRGRHARNLYASPWDEALLEQPVGALRKRLAVDVSEHRATPADQFAFARWIAAVVGFQLAIAAVLFGIPAVLIFG